MALAIELAGENVRQGTGGPFGALVVDSVSGRLVSAGVNLVMPSANCTAHAEMVAIGLADRAVGTYDLGPTTGHAYELVSSVDPCAMCLGAVVWSGVTRLVCGAHDSDARAIGFDEGPKPDAWVTLLESRGIEVVRSLCRASATAVLAEYADRGGTIYNAHR